MLVRVGGKDTESVVAALGEQIKRLPKKTITATLTWDRGPEMAAHKNFTIATDVSVYFCDPKSPWQSGTSENANRLFCGSTCPEGPSFRCTIKPTST